jgi:anti-anti-sigma factor
MTTATATEVSPPSLLANSGFLSQPWVDHAARLASRRLKSSVAVIVAYGEIDASNAGALTEYALGHMTGCRALILDLRGLDFFGAEGFCALHRVSVCCERAGVGWAVLPSAATSRVLRICDSQARLPTADTIDAALATFQNQPQRPPALIARRETSGQSATCARMVCVVCGGTNGSSTTARG